ncbi:MAG: ABC transporter permease [Bacteroidales bacterium]|nr:ABC transporter permease [Bacteroidales bacterium]HNW74566.1 ABC transporter permease [Bacteroidales bacterium]HPS50123.1 ABC transporter permease [Bacteroidales bacterium]
MKKIFLIIQREYLTRVKKRSFIIMTILGPVLMAATIIIPIYLATQTNELKTVAVLDETGIFKGKFKDTDNIRFHYLTQDINTAKANFARSGDHALLYIPKTEVTLPNNAIIYSENNVNINVKSHIKNVMSRQLEEMKLQARLRELQGDRENQVSVDDILRSIKTSVDINTLKIGDDGKESKSYTELSMILGMFAGILIYFFIFMFGSQVMRGVIEEKTSRIVEVIVSSVKPFQLMMGKIIGVGLVGLTQFMLWVVLTFIIVTAVTATMTSGSATQTATEQLLKQNQVNIQPEGQQIPVTPQKNGDELTEVMDAIHSVDFPVMIGSFLFFFVVGYLLYAAFFAAIGGAVDSEADTQQFMFPITIPLILSIILSQFIIQDPDGPVAFWLSIFPLTAPVIMMIRIPFGVPFWEVFLSMAILILGFLGTTWLAAKIYRTGILMYGKKITYGELWKWIRYKN